MEVRLVGKRASYLLGGKGLQLGRFSEFGKMARSYQEIFIPPVGLEQLTEGINGDGA